MSGDGADDGDDGADKQEYVKKDFVAKPYTSETGMLEEVENSIIKDSRPRLKMRISRQRRDYGQDGFNFIDKDATQSTEFSVPLQSTIKNIMYMENTKKKVLDIGLQAAHQMKRIQTQTYFGRSVNKACQYDPSDFIGQDETKGEQTEEQKAKEL